MKVSSAVSFQVAQQNHYATLSLDVTGKLAQGYDAQNNIILNSWEGTANTPVITPNIIVGGGFSMTDKVVTWYRLDKSTDSIGDSTKIGEMTLSDSTGETPFKSGMFTINQHTGALTILKDLASASNQDPDTFVCKVDGKINNAPIGNPLMRAAQMTIMPVGADGYLVVVEAWNDGTTQYKTTLTSGDTFTWLKATVYNAAGEVTNNVTYQWKKGGADFNPASANVGDGGQRIKVARADVDWEEVFGCVVSVGGSEVGLGSIVVTDQADDYKVVAQLEGTITQGNSSTGLLSFQLFKDSVDGDEIGQWQTFSVNGTYNIKVLDAAHATIINHTTGATMTAGKGSVQIKSEDLGGIESGTLLVECMWT